MPIFLLPFLLGLLFVCDRLSREKPRSELMLAAVLSVVEWERVDALHNYI
jgi:hypothetical protein